MQATSPYGVILLTALGLLHLNACTDSVTPSPSDGSSLVDQGDRGVMSDRQMTDRQMTDRQMTDGQASDGPRDLVLQGDQKAPHCGDGHVDPGEDCDGDPCCDKHCHFLADFASCTGGVCRQHLCRSDTKQGIFSVYQVFDAAKGNYDLDYPGYHPPGVLTSFAFFAASSALTGMHPLYNCKIGTDTFVSKREDCEGQVPVSKTPIGWVEEAKGNDRFEIVRCRGGGDHAVGGDATCPHSHREDALGYSKRDPSLCGNRIVDAGEFCDGSWCCSTTCSKSPDGTTCPLGTCSDFICRQDVTKATGGSSPTGCLAHLFDGKPGDVAELNIPIDFNGRPTVGDLDNDGAPDFIMARRDRIAAYTVCGKKLWDIPIATNWDFSKHYFWNYTTYGYVGDADGDGKAEFLHIGADWRTLYVREGLTGHVKYTITLPAGIPWMYVFLARRAGDKGTAATRVVASAPGYASDFAFASYDLRSGKVVGEWTYRKPMGTAKSVYLTPQAANLDGQGGDEIVYGTLALSGSGAELWRFNVGSMSMLSAIHAATVADIDPARPGLECVYSIYGPNKGQPSLVTFGIATRGEIWRAYSPHGVLHPHEHAVADFDVSHPGLETLARNNNGFDHWMVDAQGKLLRKSWRVHPGWDHDGEYVQAINWNGGPTAEVLYAERHVSNDGIHAIRSRMVIVSPRLDRILTPHLAGGVMEDTRTWTGTTSQPYFNPYEAADLTVDVIGDGREEVLTWGNKKLTIYYNTGNEHVKKRWGNVSYEARKKISCPLYSPR